MFKKQTAEEKQSKTKQNKPIKQSYFQFHRFHRPCLSPPKVISKQSYRSLSFYVCSAYAALRKR